MRRKTNLPPHPPQLHARRRRPDGLRELTVSDLHRSGGYFASDSERVPCLRIAARWLEQYGFVSGTRVVVAAERGKLVLTISDPTSSVPTE